MNAKLIGSLALATIFLSGGCNRNQDYQYTETSVNYRQATMDAKILGTVMVINKNEIEAAQVAQHNSANRAVKHFAGLMVKEHGMNLQEIAALSKRLGVAPVEGNLAMMLQRKGHHELRVLNSLHDGAFDKAYMAAMVKGHKNVLNLIDQKLLPEARSEQVRVFLKNTRAHVLKHLQYAEMIQNSR